MVEKKNESRGENPAVNADDRVVSERVQELTWALVDEQLSDDEFRLLENLLLSDDKARHAYVSCMQLHADLITHFAGPPAEVGEQARGGSQVLGFLNADLPLGIQSPTGKETTP